MTSRLLVFRVRIVAVVVATTKRIVVRVGDLLGGGGLSLSGSCRLLIFLRGLLFVILAGIRSLAKKRR
jgi:hypothetical protein